MPKVSEIYHKLNTIAPFEKAMSFDNCGLLVGSMHQEVSRCIFALDITNDLIDYAINQKAQLIITHHPVIFNPIYKINDDNIVFALIQNNISVISAHTNLDIATGGVNDALAEKIGLKDVRIIEDTDEVVRIGYIEDTMLGEEFAFNVKNILRAKGVTVINGQNKVHKIAISSGAGSDYLQAVINSDADAFLTGEVKHNIMIEAINSAITLVCAGHHYTEIVVFDKLIGVMQDSFIDVEFEIYDDFLIDEV